MTMNPLRWWTDFLLGERGRTPLPALLTNEQRYRMALEAILEAPAYASDIAERALGEA